MKFCLIAFLFVAPVVAHRAASVAYDVDKTVRFLTTTITKNTTITARQSRNQNAARCSRSCVSSDTNAPRIAQKNKLWRVSVTKTCFLFLTSVPRCLGVS
jgi:hypothetical protein